MMCLPAGYGQDTDKGAPTVVIMYRLLCALKKKIDDTKREKEDRKSFTIEHAGEVPTMRVRQAPNTAEGEEQQQQQQQEGKQ
jgi:hypothetical protein